MQRSAVIALAIAVVVVAAGVLLALQAPGGGGGVKLVVVTRLSPEEQEAIRESFLASSIAREYGITDIEFRKLDYALWRDLAKSGKVDGFFIGEQPVYESLCREGLLRPLDLPELLDVVQGLPEGLVGKAPGGGPCWVVVGRAVYGMIVNREFLARYQLPEPETWKSLMDPVYAKSLPEAPVASFPLPSKSGTARTTVQALLQRYGWEDGWRLLTVLGGLSRLVDSSEKARDEAAEGVAGVAPAYIGYGILAERVGKGAVFKIPRGEGVMYVSPAAVAVNARHPREMQAFILWLLSEDGQRRIAELFYYIPVRPVKGIEWVERIYREMEGNIFEYDRELAGATNLAVTYYFEAAIGDPEANNLLKTILSRLYEKVSQGTMSREEYAKIIEELGAPLAIKDPLTGEEREFTLDYAKQVNEALKDPKTRDAFIAAVREAALKRYQEILGRLG